LMKWLRGRNVVAVRPWVVYNHLAVRAALNEAMGNPEVTPASINTFDRPKVRSFGAETPAMPM